MWPFKKKQEHQIFFTCEDWAIRKYAPIQPAKNFLPKKFKDMQTYVKQEKYPIDSIKTVKSCPGIIDYCSAGFVIPAWCDIELTPSPDGMVVEQRYSSKKFRAGHHPVDQLQDFLIKKFTVRMVAKLDNPWKMWAAPGYSLLYQPMYFYDEDRNWEAVPGWVDHDVGAVGNPINVMLKENKPVLIKMGEPLVQVIPIKREPIVAYTGESGPTTWKRYNGLSYMYDMTFNTWVKYMKDKKSYTVDEHDVELPYKVD
jgi:hypothetical protein